MVEYDVRVKTSSRAGSHAYLWGGRSVNYHCDVQMALTVRNHLRGEAVHIQINRGDGRDDYVGLLEPGQVITFALKDVVGVYAWCDQDPTVDTIVHCTLHPAVPINVV